MTVADLQSAGEARRPAIDVLAPEIMDMAFGLIRVLDDEGNPHGPWIGDLGVDELVEILTTMFTTRAFDARMMKAQRQGKTSFSMGSRGEEAIGAVTATVMGAHDMCFPTYRQASYLLGRGRDPLAMMNQVYGNAADENLGTQISGLYTSSEFGFLSISGNLATQMPQAVGWAMAAKIKGDPTVALAFVGDGSTAESDMHAALTFASTYTPPVIVAIVNNQYAISTDEEVARGSAQTFAQRGIGYGLPSLRVDGNDVLAVHGATTWARDRALAGHGPTVIEFVTYRGSAHSSSDDPTRYRPEDEFDEFPLGDPIKRLRLYLQNRGFSNDQANALDEQIRNMIEAKNEEAEAIGTINTGERPSLRHTFELVYETMPPHLIRQRQEAGI